MSHNASILARSEALFNRILVLGASLSSRNAQLPTNLDGASILPNLLDDPIGSQSLPYQIYFHPHGYTFLSLGHRSRGLVNGLQELGHALG